jgi:hypothetical protein
MQTNLKSFFLRFDPKPDPKLGGKDGSGSGNNAKAGSGSIKKKSDTKQL